MAYSKINDCRATPHIDGAGSLTDLERDGFIESVIGKGSFVKAANSELMKESILFVIEEFLEKAADKAVLGNVSLDEMKEMLTIIYEEKTNGRNR